MYKISDEVINFIEKTMKTWRVEMTTALKQRSKRDALSSLLFVIAMMPLTTYLVKAQEETNFINRMKDQQSNVHRRLPKAKKNWKP